MTRSAHQVRHVLALAEAGVALTHIVDATGVPRSTVRDWLAGRVPSAGRVRGGRMGCWRCDPTVACPEAAYVRLLGVYLGDGSLAEFPRGVYRLTLTQDARYTRLIDEWRSLVAAALGNSTSVQSRPGCVLITSYSKHWPCLFPQHGPGRKHERSIQLHEWQRALVARHPAELVRGLVESDGCRHVNRVTTRGKRYDYVRYNFTNSSEDILGIFTTACDLLGIRWTRMNPKTIAVSRRRDVDVLDGFIGPKS